MIRNLTALPALMLLAVLAACSGAPQGGSTSSSDDHVVALTDAIMDLGPHVDPKEAARAARISYEYPLELKQKWRATEPAIVNNVYINLGMKPAGLCYQWAEAMYDRLEKENFKTLDILRAISPDHGFHLEHNTAVIVRHGGDLMDGILVDPWRYSGRLFWSKLPDDKRFKWEDRRAYYDRHPERGL